MGYDFIEGAVLFLKKGAVSFFMGSDCFRYAMDVDGIENGHPSESVCCLFIKSNENAPKTVILENK